jgi:hypothetical protein
MKEVPKNIFMDSFYETDFSDLRVPQIAVYYNTLDFPNKYVARVFDAVAKIPCGVKVPPEVTAKAIICEKCGQPHEGVHTVAATNHVIVRDTLEEIREGIPDFFGRISRSPEDEPHIVEVWI